MKVLNEQLRKNYAVFEMNVFNENIPNHVLLKGFDASAMDSSNKNMPFRKMDDVKIQHSSH
ncbi:MAG: hypothetical protein E7Z77_02075 [Methanobrevibacter sp.]|uniref:hypothetical protein n=1 Tax=Methanobrevibacter sp. TaxID=66852 RepID=UPI0025E0A496|nr:hypothetical protein [Methanobrevibacter sp.]MBE6508180.1 hypothetical protein [Methanobrevibacter sp.]